MNFTLLHTAEFDIAPIEAALLSEGVVAVLVESGSILEANDGPTVFVSVPEDRSSFSDAQLRGFIDSGGSIVAIGTENEPDIPEALDEELLAAYLPRSHGTRQLLLALKTAYRAAAARADSISAREEAALRTREIGELTKIGMALSTEHDYEEL
ncbi:MAG: hypothetical protein JSW51_08120, partial [Gemmatimonadota bacterium]